MNRQRIALISEHASPLAALGGTDAGGQNIAVSELAQHLANLGYEIDVFTRWDDKRLPEIISWRSGVRIVHIQAGETTYIPKEALLPHMDEFTANTLAFFKREKYPYKLIHAHFWMSALVAANIKQHLGTPFVVTFHALGKVRQQHQGKQDTFPKERLAIEKRVIREADHVIALCPQDKDDLLRLYQAEPEKITIIPNGYNAHEFYPIDKLLARMVLGLDAKEKIVLQLGRLVPRKGISTVITALQRAKRDHGVTARLLIVGGGSDEPDPAITPEIGRLQRLAARQGVADHVTFTGRRGREYLRYYYSAADIFVTTPWYEPFGMTPLEAMACGTPVIGSAVGGLTYTIQDGSNGFLVPPKNPGALARRMSELLQSGRLLAYFGENALRSVHPQFTWGTVANQTAMLYDKIIRSSPTRIEGEHASLSMIGATFDELADTARRAKRDMQLGVLDAALALARSLRQDGKVLVCGNGGSAAQAQHFAAELTGSFEIPGRRALPVIPLTTDGTFLTAWGNDAQFTDIFARQIQAHGNPGDVLLCLTTSGESPNVIEAIKMARSRGLFCVVLSGKGGGSAARLADIPLVVPSAETTRVQEIHLTILHTLCKIIEQAIVEDAYTQTHKHLTRSALKELETLLTPGRTAGKNKGAA